MSEDQNITLPSPANLLEYGQPRDVETGADIISALTPVAIHGLPRMPIPNLAALREYVARTDEVPFFIQQLRGKPTVSIVLGLNHSIIFRRVLFEQIRGMVDPERTGIIVNNITTVVKKLQQLRCEARQLAILAREQRKLIKDAEQQAELDHFLDVLKFGWKAALKKKKTTCLKYEPKKSA